MAPIDTTVQDFIKKHDLIPQDQPILVAISGGPDSVFLAHLLRQLGYEIGLAHMNYHLRGEASDLDQALVERYADQLDVPVYIQDADPKAYAKAHQQSLQVACRELRYLFFEAVLNKEEYRICATAHHADDQVETVLMSLLRANGTAVFKGIPIRRGPYIRPILSVGKGDILAYLDTHQLPYRIDQSNQSKAYFRNQLRHDLIPTMEEIQPTAKRQILSRYAWYQEREALLQSLLKPYLETALSEEGIHKQIDLSSVQADLGIRGSRLVLAQILEQWGIHGHILWQAIGLLDSESGKWVETPIGRLVKGRHGFHLLSHTMSTVKQDIPIDSKTKQRVVYWANRRLEFSRLSSPPARFAENDRYFLNADRLVGPLFIRAWHIGDRMIPLGMAQSKKLSDIFIDEKYNAVQKQEAWLLCDQKGIVCVGGFRIAERVRLSKQSSNILSIVDTHFSELDT